ncbi:hypothetical protein GQ53DRAFT_744764 [Thozetella sp. PMI_491]|nr:hypothetical protein GQ53DRAFT_744764 [Thozetella sp. PMI_491]
MAWGRVPARPMVLMVAAGPRLALVMSSAPRQCGISQIPLSTPRPGPSVSHKLGLIMNPGALLPTPYPTPHGRADEGSMGCDCW